MNNKLVSVVIPMYNAKQTIRFAIESVLNQTYLGEIEVIVINDGSKDGCEKDIQELILNNKTNKIIKLINKSNGGVSSARNCGIQKANGEYIAFLDSDDVWHPQKLEVIIKLMEENKISILGHSYTLVKNDLNFFNILNIYKVSFLRILLKNITQTSCIIVQKDICEYFNEDMTHTEDHDLWLRIALKNDVYYIDLPFTTLGRPQLSQGGLSSNRWAMRKGEMQMYINIAKQRKFLMMALPLLFLFSLLKYFRIYFKKELDR